MLFEESGIILGTDEQIVMGENAEEKSQKKKLLKVLLAKSFKYNGTLLTVN
jgi:hypothetical protein